METQKIKTYKEFYQFYLSEHSKPLTRLFHFIGILLVFVVISYVLQSGKERFLWYCPIFGFGLGWLSHAIFEKSIPLTFRYPVWTLIADFQMFFELIILKQKLYTPLSPEKH